MRSQEYVQLHALLQEIRATVEENQQTADAFEAYDTQPVRPVHVHLSKAQHRRAIFLLLEGISETLETQASPEVAV
ncbi:UPF0058 family protein [Natronorubrum aibiense]|uniref:Metal-binding protein n=1 Tax=Natronorubrum aibiense TaxID=348826 RepID=A0A5P9P415_9EURY|nr:UPF0058 family protein [Natronorubrum aibiense]QFU82878.1 metal-binding protein [Natronorubrum aibiense]